MRYHSKMTAEKEKQTEEKKQQLLEEICENSRAIRRVANRILDHLHESGEKDEDADYDPELLDWYGLNGDDDIYH